MPFGSAAHGMVLKAMQDRGYPADFFQLVSQSPEVGSTNLQEKKIDAHADFVPFAELLPFRGFARKIFDGVETNLPTFHGVVVRTDFAEKYPEVVVAYIKALIAANQWLRADPKLAAEKIQEWTGINKEVVYIFLGPSGNMTTDPTIKPALIDAAATDVKVLQNLGRMKEFDPKKWVDDSYIRKAYAEMKLDYDAQLASTKNYEISGEDKFCKKPITDPRKAGEVWVDDDGILPFSSAACTLGAYADFKAKGKKINVAYVFDTTRGIKLFADQAFFAVGSGDDRAVPAEEGRGGLCRQERRQGAGLRRRGEGGGQRRQDVSSPAHPADIPRTACRPQPLPKRARRPPSRRRRNTAVASARLPLRWYRLNQGRLRAIADRHRSRCSPSCCVWHLLTNYRVVFFVRFTNVPSPLAVYASFTKAIHDPKFLLHIVLELPAHPASASRSRRSSACRSAWSWAASSWCTRSSSRSRRCCGRSRRSPGCRWRSCCGRPTSRASSSSPSSARSFRSWSTRCTACRWSIPCWCAPRNASARAKRSIFREVYFPASLPHIFTGLTVGMGVAWVSLIAAEMISGQYGIGYFTWEAYSLVQYADIALGMIAIGVLGLASSAADPRRRAAGDAVEARHERDRQPIAASKGHIDGHEFRAELRHASKDRSRPSPIRDDPRASPASSSRSSARPAAASRRCSTRSRASSSRPRGDVTVDGERVERPERRARHGVPAIFAVSLEDGAGERRVRPEDARHAAHRSASAPRARCSGSPGCEAFENHYPDQLSGGMKQRVGIVRALATGPKVLLLDEPFGALDAQTRVIMQQILTNMWQRLKISVLFVTHDIDEAIFLSDRVYCMTARPGSIKAEIPIPLERPRQQSMMMSSEFLALRRGLMSLIREESLKAMGGEINDIGMQGLNIELHGHSLADVIYDARKTCDFVGWAKRSVPTISVCAARWWARRFCAIAHPPAVSL